MHDIRGCRCLFLVRYNHDNTEASTAVTFFIVNIEWLLGCVRSLVFFYPGESSFEEIMLQAKVLDHWFNARDLIYSSHFCLIVLS